MNDEEIQVLRSGAASSLSGRSTITYDIGGKGDSEYIRLSGNSAGGIFCKEWVSMADIHSLLAGSPNVTSKTLQSLFAGRSSNSPGFLAACIINENIATEKASIPTETASPTSAPEVTPQKKPAKARKDTTKEISS